MKETKKKLISKLCDKQKKKKLKKINHFSLVTIKWNRLVFKYFGRRSRIYIYFFFNKINWIFRLHVERRMILRAKKNKIWPKKFIFFFVRLLAIKLKMITGLKCEYQDSSIDSRWCCCSDFGEMHIVGQVKWKHEKTRTRTNENTITNSLQIPL